MAKPTPRSPLCIIIAGPNGAGKTTFAEEYLDKEVGVVHFINVDAIARGLSLRPELAAVAAGRMFLRELDRSASERQDFAFESTLSGRSYVARLRRWKSAGYRVRIIYFFGCLLLVLRSGASPVVSNTAATTCRPRTCSDASSEAGETSTMCIGF
ncbi:MAG TPA: zeta toxin family protein [Candidatus Binatia bacterium]|jgi:hypothetical protein